jgi:two-component system, chemotaxis family, protein-glutamate methylesterase/glutaminase
MVVIGASAGGVSALRLLAGALPADFAASVFVVQHQAPDAPELLPNILDQAGPLRAAAARDGMGFQPESIVVAPPDMHLVLTQDRCRLLHPPQEGHHQSSIDALFCSAAEHLGPRVIGVILTGLLDDGAAGLAAVKRCGGLAIVQDPADAEFPDMPRNALAATPVDHCIPLAELVPLLTRLTMWGELTRGAEPDL